MCLAIFSACPSFASYDPLPACWTPAHLPNPLLDKFVTPPLPPRFWPQVFVLLVWSQSCAIGFKPFFLSLHTSSSLVRKQQQLLSCVNCFPPGPCSAAAYYSDLHCQPADNLQLLRAINKSSPTVASRRRDPFRARGETEHGKVRTEQGGKENKR